MLKVFLRFFWLGDFVLLLDDPATAENASRVRGLETAIVRSIPKYPYQSRVNGEEGRGVFRVNLDRATGAPTGVEILQSTGHRRLDDSAKRALLRWRFIANKFDAVRIPISFELAKASPDELAKARRYAINSPEPPYPLDCLRANIGGSGRFRFNLNFETGEVQDVEILRSTGDARLDRVTVKAFHQWRFRPRTMRTFDVPYTFTEE